MHFEADRHGVLYGTSFRSIEDVVSRSKICILATDVTTAVATVDSRRFEALRARARDQSSNQSIQEQDGTQQFTESKNTERGLLFP